MGREDIEIWYCPTENMIADFFTKPLQGSLFRRFRDFILGYIHIEWLNEETEESLTNERVEKNVIAKTVTTVHDSPSLYQRKEKTVTYADAVKGLNKWISITNNNLIQLN